MPSELKSKWLAVNLFYNEPWEAFLIKALKPYIDTIVQTGIAEQYFFLRYWERGPHIKFRIKGEAMVLDQILLPNLEEYFENYFESIPSKRTDPNYPPNFPDQYKWFANNSLVYANYNPNPDPFGGLIGLAIAEKQFQVSSQIVLRSLKKKGTDWSYDEALGMAIKFHLSFIHTMGLSLEEGIEFFQAILKVWMPKAFRFYSKRLNPQLFKTEEHKMLKTFEEAFELQKDTLIPFHSALWRGLNKTGDFEDQDLNYWINSHEEIRSDLQIAWELDQLIISPKYKVPTSLQHLSKDQLLLWSIYAEMIHYTNNRLGISQKDEGFLAYLILNSLKAIQGQEISLEQIRGVSNQNS